MTSERGWKTFMGPFFLLILIYLVWFARYPMWRLLENVEFIFIVLILSYFIVLLFAMVLLKKDLGKALSRAFNISNYQMVLVGIVFAFLFQAMWFLICLGIGGKLEFLSFPSLKGYESYAVYSTFLAFALYLTFAVFGAFVEEVAFRGYVQSRIASRYSPIISVFVTSLFFSLQHIHIFELSWIVRFFQTQFIYVFCFGIFVGYLFFKGKENIWSVFAFHALMNIFNVSLPIEVTFAFPSANQFVTITSFILVILLLRFLPFSRNKSTSLAT